MTWQSTLSWENAQKRAGVIQQIRTFFAERNVLEVETPALSQSTVTDVYLDALSCQYNFLADSSHHNSASLYLQTSPEFHMKRLLASGYGSIFQIAKSFRHEGAGRYHNPEFTMLEWYRLGFDHIALMDEVELLLMTVLQCEKPIRKSYQELFIENVALDPLTASRDELLELIQDKSLLSDWLANENDADILLQFIFSEIIEPNIGQQCPCFVYNFPSSQASLAQLCEDDPRVAHRFECYFKGVELVNGFNELTSAEDQIKRFQDDNTKRNAVGLPSKKIDQNFILALKHGLPQCAGVAMGVDRFIMLALNQNHIEQVISFPIEKA